MRRTAFSLLELMIVMAILAAVLAVSWPALRRPLARSDVQEAAEQLARSLRAARLASIEHGEIYQLRYRPGNADYQQGPAFALAEPERGRYQGDRTRESTRSDARLASPGQSVSRDSDLDRVRPHHRSAANIDLVEKRSLHQDITFEPRPHDRHPRQQLPRKRHPAQRPEPLATSGRSDSWSGGNAILFFPDGRSSGGNLRLLSSNGYQVTLDVRALTGGVTIGSVRHVALLAQADETATRSGGQRAADAMP